MTSIKPPNGPVPSDPVVTGSSTARGPDRAGASFRELLGPSGLEAAGASAPQHAQLSADPATLADAVRSGALQPEQALERLVERAVLAAGALSEAQQAELREVLRQALQADPALRELRDALGAS